MSAIPESSVITLDNVTHVIHVIQNPNAVTSVFGLGP